MVDDAGTSAQRIRVGLTGLAVAFLLVLLGSAVSRYARDEVGNGTQQASVNGAVDEPLAELGVAPGGADGETSNTVAK